jgi:hypothetical protein
MVHIHHTRPLPSEAQSVVLFGPRLQPTSNPQTWAVMDSWATSPDSTPLARFVMLDLERAVVLQLKDVADRLMLL